ncbi:CLC5A protein, partial [Bucco capensis]|nr:CLC5A protein [Bucco capensis]
MSENLIYADLNLTEPTRPRLQKITDVQDSTYAEVKVQSLDTNAVTNHTSPGKSHCSRRCIAILVAVMILLLVLAVCLIFLYHTTESSPSDSETFSSTSDKTLRCPKGWEKSRERCYLFCQTENKSWTDSRTECTNRDADLVIIDNKEELNYLQNISQLRGQYYFIGLKYSMEEEKWVWINNVEHSRDMFAIRGRHHNDYLCTVIGPRLVETASCDGAPTTHILCEKAANISQR